MFKMQLSTQTDDTNWGNNLATDEKCILTKMDLKFRNPEFKISCEIALYIFFVIKCETFGVNRSMRPFWNK